MPFIVEMKFYEEKSLQESFLTDFEIEDVSLWQNLIFYICPAILSKLPERLLDFGVNKIGSYWSYFRIVKIFPASYQ